MESAFAQYEPRGYPYRFRGKLIVEVLAGGTPSNRNVAEAWIRAKGGAGDALIVEQVSEVMAERGVDENAAIEEVARNRHLTGFKRVPHELDDGYRDPGFVEHRGQLYAEGRQLKACVKEAASVAADAGKIKPRGLGETNARKGILSFVAEHIFVCERRLYIYRDGEPVTEPTDIHQSFVHTFRGSGIQLTEIVEGAEIDFTVETDKRFDDEFWAMLWLTAQNQGLGAGRSQGYGRFTVTEWEPIVAPSRRATAPSRRVTPPRKVKAEA